MYRLNCFSKLCTFFSILWSCSWFLFLYGLSNA